MSAAFPLAKKALRNQRAHVLDYLNSRGVTQVRERIANSTHLMIEFFHAERWHPILISGSGHSNADPTTLTLIRRILGREPKETKQRERRGAPKRQPSQANTPTVTAPRYRPRFRDEPNAMTRSLREHFASNAWSEPSHAGIERSQANV